MKMDELVFLEVLEELEIAEYNNAGRVAQGFRHIRNPVDELNNEEFRNIYRLTKELFYFLVETIEPFLTPKVRNTDLGIHEK